MKVNTPTTPETLPIHGDSLSFMLLKAKTIPGISKTRTGNVIAYVIPTSG